MLDGKNVGLGTDPFVFFEGSGNETTTLFPAWRESLVNCPYKACSNTHPNWGGW